MVGATGFEPFSLKLRRADQRPPAPKPETARFPAIFCTFRFGRNSLPVLGFEVQARCGWLRVAASKRRRGVTPVSPRNDLLRAKPRKAERHGHRHADRSLSRSPEVAREAVRGVRRDRAGTGDPRVGRRAARRSRCTTGTTAACDASGLGAIRTSSWKRRGRSRRSIAAASLMAPIPQARSRRSTRRTTTRCRRSTSCIAAERRRSCAAGPKSRRIMEKEVLPGLAASAGRRISGAVTSANSWSSKAQTAPIQGNRVLVTDLRAVHVCRGPGLDRSESGVADQETGTGTQSRSRAHARRAARALAGAPRNGGEERRRHTEAAALADAERHASS